MNGVKHSLLKGRFTGLGLSFLRHASTGCGYGVCATAPFVASTGGTAVALAGASVPPLLVVLSPFWLALHWALFLLIPLYVVLLWRGFRQHRRPLGLIIGSLGGGLILVHLATHFVPMFEEFFLIGPEINFSILSDWFGGVLLMGGVVINMFMRRRTFVHHPFR